jgi:rhodanese-related sulfurtransferase
MGSLPSKRTAAEGSRRDATSPPSVEELLERARLRLTRITATQAAAEQKKAALLVDIRTAEQRQKDGEIPGALAIERTVLEWRLDPASDSRIPPAVDHEIRVILICAEGYSSSLAAASLQDLGLVNATDVIGGFDAWVAAGLPIER